MITVEVTQEDIKNGEARSPDWCPIALALRRQFPTATRIYAGYYCAVGSRWFIAVDHPTYKRFIKTFDRHEAVDPLTLVLKELYPL